MNQAHNLVEIFLSENRLKSFVEAFKTLFEDISAKNPKLNDSDIKNFIGLYFSHMMEHGQNISEDDLWDFIDDIDFYDVRFEKIEASQKAVIDATNGIIRECYPSVAEDMIKSMETLIHDVDDNASLMIELCEKMNLETTLMATYTEDKSHILFSYNAEV